MVASGEYEQSKFRKIDKYLLKSLVNGEIYFSRPDRLNDPFDCRVNIRKSLENAISRGEFPIRKKLENLRGLDDFFVDVERRISTLGICAFSRNPTQTLMWSHYGDEHKGVCLTYSFPKSYFYENKDHILGVSEMDYGVTPLSDWLLAEGYRVDSFEKFRDELLIKMLTVKADPWRYEEEVRIIRNSEGVEALGKQYLKRVCFGLHTSESDMALIRKIMEQYDYEISLCKMKRSFASDFGIEMEEIS